ncbi:TrkH family potassium uptake protein [Anianabacter salinae]|uniref:TrkH family potassium uptake protein n=1 Tax=Anianabacter salinae TaxID=2851023 RepID=UPI00225E3922|nr:potassium transporter TrkG [Anianabacter salinae]MBV0913068.1 Ktr system potassium transporter B [Anianabacter salinae]
MTGCCFWASGKPCANSRRASDVASSPRRINGRAARLSLRRLPPPAVLAILYLSLIVLGAVLLRLPISQTGTVTWGEAIFTSASAVTVTGLTLSDTGASFTYFGQGVIAALIQMGGLGLMTFAVLLFQALGIPVNLSGRSLLREDLNQTSLHELAKLTAVIFRIALLFEGAGALLLLIVFVPEHGWAVGTWHAVFHAISAFNNAGFSLYPDSLMRWSGHPVVNTVIPALFIVGGIGFIVLADIWKKRRWQKLMLHSKLMLMGSAILLAVGMLTVAALEWTNPATLGGLGGPFEKLAAAWFQSATARTAGFNTIDTGGLHAATSMMVIALMIIGAGSTSTGGGIKVTTFLVLLLATVAFFKRRETLHIFGRSLGISEVIKVMALTTISMLSLVVAVFIVAINHDGDVFDLGFEVASAFGTVGLSRGATGDLDAVGRAVIIAMMFLGRVGPLTLGFFLATRSAPRVRYPAGQVYLG